MSTELDLTETFESLKTNLIAPPATAIAGEAGRRQGLRRSMKMVASVGIFVLAGLGIFAGSVGFTTEGSPTSLELTDAIQPVLPLDEVDQLAEPFRGVVVDENPFLRYVTQEDPDSVHPGSALFILVDEDGSPALVGSEDFPALAVNVDVWRGVGNPLETTLGYLNVSLDSQGLVDRAACAGFWAGLQRDAAGQFQLTNLPVVEDRLLAHSAVFCPDGIEPDNIFAGFIDIEFNDEAIVVTSEDGTRWPFRQVPNQLQ